MKRPLLISLIVVAGGFIALGGLILVLALHQQQVVVAKNKADAFSICNKKYGQGSYDAARCADGYDSIITTVTSPSKDSQYNQALTATCPNPAHDPNPYHVSASVVQQTYQSCLYGATQAFNTVNAPKSSSPKSSTSSSPSSGSSKSSSSNSKSSSSSKPSGSTSGSTAAKTTASSKTASTANDVAATTTGPSDTPVVPLDNNAVSLEDTQCSNGGVKVSDVWGLAHPCIGGNGVNPIFALISYAITYATGIFGLILVLMIVIAGLQYILSGADPDVAKAAKDRLRNAFTGLVLFLLMFAIIQLILPADARVF